jgi:subtilisin family serine protease
MTITVTFNTAENCAAFAKIAKLDVDADATTLKITWEKLTKAKADPNAVEFAQDNDDPVEFVINGDPASADIAPLVQVNQDLGKGFFHVTSTKGLELFDKVKSLDAVELTPMGFHGVSSLTGSTATAPSVITDPTGTDGQWARIRIASTYRPLLTSFTYYDSLVVKSKPEVYVIDSGVDWTHPEFANLDHDDFWKMPDFADFSDVIGHGTKVASCIAGVNVGIARDLKLRSIKIVEPNYTPTLLNLGAALEAIITEAKTNPNLTRIVNASWSIDKNSWIESKFQELLDAGITVICSAGNTGIDVATQTPAGMPAVITVGAIDKYDIPAGFNNIAPSDSGLTTNYGNMLDIFAPGDNVVVANGDAYELDSGTSFSTGYVTGVAAQLAALFAEEVPFPDLAQKLLDLSTKDAILFDHTNFVETENRIVHLIGAQDIQATALDLYLGVFDSDTNTMNLDSNTILNVAPYVALNPASAVNWTLSFETPEVETAYGSFIKLDAASGKIDIDKPTVALPEGETLKMVRFKVHAATGAVTLDSPWLFFFQVDETADTASTQNDITRALSLTNSTSVFLAQATLK